MKSSTRLARVDALRALALLPVLVMNMGSYHSPDTGPLLQPHPEGSVLALGLVWLATALLAGKGVTLLNFLLGYGLTLGRDPARRAHRLLLLGLLHGFLLYFGDILSAYALAMMMALRHRRERLRSLCRRGLAWLGLGLLLMLGLGVLISLGAPAEPQEAGLLGAVAQASGLWLWWRANLAAYGAALIGLVLTLPSTYGLTLLGLAAGRLRLLTHRRWAGLLRRWARWALPLLILNLIVAWPLARVQGMEGMVLSWILALFTLPSWMAWLLCLRQLPVALALAGRNTLSIYLAGSLLIVGLLSGAGLHWAGSSAAIMGLALVAWVLLLGCSAWAANRGWRLPAEAWMARRT